MEEQHIPVVLSLAWTNRGSNASYSTPTTRLLTITPQRGFLDKNRLHCTVYIIMSSIHSICICFELIYTGFIGKWYVYKDYLTNKGHLYVTFPMVYGYSCMSNLLYMLCFRHGHSGNYSYEWVIVVFYSMVISVKWVI